MTNRDRSTILVVEHDDVTRQFLADHLTADGFDVLAADCAREGLRRLETAFPDPAIIDVELEDHSDLELLGTFARATASPAEQTVTSPSSSPCRAPASSIALRA